MPKMKSIILTVFLFLSALFLGGCPYSSSVPLSPCSEAEIDEVLLGRWGMYEEQKLEGVINIFAFNEHEVLVLVEEEGKEMPETYRAYTSHVGGENFLNLQFVSESLTKERTWMLINYVVSGDEMRLKMIDDTLFQEKPMSSEELARRIEDNLDNEKLYGEDPVPMILKRIEE